MSVTVRPHVNGGWEVDIRVQLPDGRVVRERKKTSASSGRRRNGLPSGIASKETVIRVHLVLRQAQDW